MLIRSRTRNTLALNYLKLYGTPRVTLPRVGTCTLYTFLHVKYQRRSEDGTFSWPHTPRNAIEPQASHGASMTSALSSCMIRPVKPARKAKMRRRCRSAFSCAWAQLPMHAGFIHMHSDCNPMHLDCNRMYKLRARPISSSKAHVPPPCGQRGARAPSGTRPAWKAAPSWQTWGDNQVTCTAGRRGRRRLGLTPRTARHGHMHMCMCMHMCM